MREFSPNKKANRGSIIAARQRKEMIREKSRYSEKYP